MLNKPKFMNPSTNIQNCVVDLNSENIPFSCVVDGNEAITKWQVLIFRLEDNVKVFDTGEIEVSPYFYPVDEKNRNVTFNIDLAPYYTPSEDFCNSDKPYYWYITIWGDSGAVVSSAEEVFYANSAPEIGVEYKKDGATEFTSLQADGGNDVILDSRKYYFRGTYIQGESIPLKRYGWRLKDLNTDRILTDTITKNQIYGTSGNILCAYDGFLDNGKYSLELFVETQNGAKIISPPYEFKTSYNTTFITSEVMVECLRDEPSVLLGWSDVVIATGREVNKIDYMGQYPIVSDSEDNTSSLSIYIPDGSSVVYDTGTTSTLDIPEDVYIVFSTQLLDSANRTLFSIEGTDDSGYDISRKLYFENGEFVYTIVNSNDELITARYTPPEGYLPGNTTWYIITLAPYSAKDSDGGILTIVPSKLINGLYPNDIDDEDVKLPSDSLYPYAGIWDKLNPSPILNEGGNE